MAWLNDPIDLERYIRIYRAQNRVGVDYKLIRFSQGKENYTATWQRPDFISTLHGDPRMLNAWLTDREAGIPLPDPNQQHEEEEKG